MYNPKKIIQRLDKIKQEPGHIFLRFDLELAASHCTLCKEQFHFKVTLIHLRAINEPLPSECLLLLSRYLKPNWRYTTISASAVVASNGSILVPCRSLVRPTTMWPEIFDDCMYIMYAKSWINLTRENCQKPLFWAQNMGCQFKFFIEEKMWEVWKMLSLTNLDADRSVIYEMYPPGWERHKELFSDVVCDGVKDVTVVRHRLRLTQEHGVGFNGICIFQHRVITLNFVQVLTVVDGSIHVR